MLFGKERHRSTSNFQQTHVNAVFTINDKADSVVGLTKAERSGKFGQLTLR